MPKRDKPERRRCCEGCGVDTRDSSGFCERCKPVRRDRDERERSDYLRHHGEEEPYQRELD